MSVKKNFVYVFICEYVCSSSPCRFFTVWMFVPFNYMLSPALEP